MNILNIIKSTYLCIKYPFLYPRNIFSDLHYTNWNLHDYIYGKNGLYNKSFSNTFIVLDYPDPDGNTTRTIHHVKNYFYAIWFYIVNFIYEYVIQLFHCIPTYTEWDAIPTGWAKAFGKQYLKELGKAVKKLPRKDRKQFRIEHIKEKYGTLQVYINFGNDEIYDIINKYENISYYTCIVCGKPATKLSGGWITPYCDEHIAGHIIEATIENGKWKYIEDNEYYC